MRDLYEILGVANNATRDEIKKSYRKLALKYHPDRNPDDQEAEKNFKEAAEAYSVLSDDRKKAQYDQFGHAGFGDIFGGSPFESFFGGGQSRGRTRGRGEDIRIKLKINYEEIASGIEKKIKIKHSVVAPGAEFITCPTCHGQGQVTQVSNTILGQMRSSTVCPHCEGSGKRIGNRPSGAGPDGMIKKEETIKIKVPAGVEEGNYMTVNGQGNEDINGSPGDLIVIFSEEEHPYFVRDGEHVILELRISYPTAVLGGRVDVPTVGGKAELKIPAGIQSGQVLRMRGKGFPMLRSKSRGDQLVKIQINTPSKINRTGKKLVEGLDKELLPIQNPFNKIEL